MKRMQRIIAIMLALLMLTGVCAAAEPQISEAGLAMMGVLVPESDLAGETVEDSPEEIEDWKLLLVKNAPVS